jgi:hypothetical protein
MATLFDGGLLASFGSVFTFLFVYVLIYGILTKIHFFGEKTEGLNALIALCAAVFTMFSPMVVGMVTYMIPWLVVLLVVGLMIWVFSSYMGMEINPKIRGGTGETVVIVIMIVVVIIFLIAFSKFYNPNGTQSSTQVVYTSQSVVVVDENGTQINSTKFTEVDNRPDWMRTLFSAKVLGLVLLLFIAGFSIKHLGPDKPA